MIERRVRAHRGPAGALVLAASMLATGGLAMGGLAGCSSVSLPFSNTNDNDRVFISAAQTWDLNKDSTVTCDEWKQYAGSAAREADANGDGALDATEWVALVRSDRLFEVATLSHYDANGDGKATIDEIVNRPNQAFKLLDKNADCQIDRNETVQIYNVDKPKPQEQDQSIVKPGR